MKSRILGLLVVVASTITADAWAFSTVTVHYRRPDAMYGDYSTTDYNDFWGLHTWGAAPDPGWTTPRKIIGADAFGVFWSVPITDENVPLGFIIHRGDEKDPGPEQFFDPKAYSAVWVNSGDVTLYYSLDAATGVPEPASLALLGLGLAGLGLSRRRKAA